MAELYSMSGLILERFPGPSPFGGYFIRNMDGDFGQRSRGSFDGMLTDNYGPSDIEGILGEEFMTFRKQYRGKENPIDYEFKFDRNKGLWVGTYSGLDCGNGKVLAWLHKDISDIDFIRNREVGVEEWSRRLVESMVEDGILVEVGVDAHGESLLRPAELH